MKKIIFLTGISIFISVTCFSQTDSFRTPKPDSTFTRVDAEAEFEGGAPVFKKILGKKLNGNVPKRNNAPSGMYMVIVVFIVNTDGTISDIAPQTHVGYGMEEKLFV